MSFTQNKAIARRFIQEIFVEGNLEDAKNFVTHDIIYHAQAEEVRGLEEFKEWIAMDRRALPDMKITILDLESHSRRGTSWTAWTS